MRTFSVVIPWRDRLELKDTLAANAAVFERHAAEVLIVNCGGDPAVVSGMLRERPVPFARQILLPTASFNPPLAKNIGTLYGAGRYVLFLDADISLISDLLDRAERALERHRCFVQVHTVYESQPTQPSGLAHLKEIVYTQRLVFDDGRVVRLRRRLGHDGSGAGPGLIAVGRQSLIEVGGFNSALGDWGFEADDLQIRLQAVTNLSLKCTGRALHLTSSRDPHAVAGETRKEAARRNKLTCADAYSRGLFRGTYDEDARVWRDRVREIPAPSRAVAASSWLGA
jgi:hypothetical protein